MVHIFLVSHDLWGRSQQFRVKCRGNSIFFRFKACEGHAVFQGLGQGVSVLAGRAKVVQPRKRLVFFNYLPFAHQHFAQNAALKVLYDLGAAGGHHLPVAARDFIDGGPGRPDDKNAKQHRSAKREKNGRHAALAMQGRVYLVHVGQVLFFL